MSSSNKSKVPRNTYFGEVRNAHRMMHVDVVVVRTEKEALILENTLIKKHKPVYNARLKDDKNYPYIKIDLTEKFPQIYVTRNASHDGSKYFGPFSSDRLKAPLILKV